mmetsp:Transcript_13906/g.35172  ORF Transcript_13906/g.35172 Transcript_13906/m.35172 type:complete len:279 (-) Transcript_13906:1381-2217(-)
MGGAPTAARCASGTSSRGAPTPLRSRNLLRPMSAWRRAAESCAWRRTRCARPCWPWAPSMARSCCSTRPWRMSGRTAWLTPRRWRTFAIASPSASWFGCRWRSSRATARLARAAAGLRQARPASTCWLPRAGMAECLSGTRSGWGCRPRFGASTLRLAGPRPSAGPPWPSGAEPERPGKPSWWGPKAGRSPAGRSRPRLPETTPQRRHRAADGPPRRSASWRSRQPRSGRSCAATGTSSSAPRTCRRSARASCTRLLAPTDSASPSRRASPSGRTSAR